MNKLDAPELTAIDISNNNLKKDDICKIKPDSFKKLAGIFVYPQITQEDAKEILYHFNHKKSEGKDTMVQIYADLIYLSREN